jgi:NADH-quinone oxidoreductase subunit G
VIYQGSHGDAGAHRADVILPGAAYTEKDATWTNTEGRAQAGRRAVLPPGDAREDWTIVRALSEVLGKRLPYDNLADLRARLVEVAPSTARIDALIAAAWGPFGKDGTVDAAPFASPIGDYFMTNPICRASHTMAECSQLAAQSSEKATGTHG